MRILMLAHRLPYPPWTGDRVRAFHIARYLSERHRLTLAFPLEGRGELGAARKLQKRIPDLEYAPLSNLRRRASALVGLAGSLPLSVRYFASRSLARRVEQRLLQDRFDLIYVSSSSMAQYATGCSIPIVMDFVDVDSDKWAQYAAIALPPMAWIYRLETRRLRRYERETARRARVSVFATPTEEAIFHKMVPDVQTAVIPNGVDSEYFRPSGNPCSRAPTVIFTGALDYFPNADGVCHFSETIFPLVRRQVPDVRFLVVGRRPCRAVLRLNRQPGITVVGDVPDVRPYMHEAHVAVVPLRIGRGIQNKILEAMAMSLPVVAKPMPAQGIGARVGVDWFVEEEPEAFAERVLRLLNDPAARAQVGHHARAFVEDRHSWRQILQSVENLVEGLATEHQLQLLAFSSLPPRQKRDDCA